MTEGFGAGGTPPTGGLPPENRKHRARLVIALLRAEYGVHEARDPLPPTDSLIATILSQHTADRNSASAFIQLQGQYASWDEIASAETDELAATIRVAGLANLKARRIQDALRMAEKEFGTMDFAFLRAMPLNEARALLLRLPGVGPKTAACVLLFSCGHPALPVDTHVHRVALRLGLLDRGTTAETAHDVLEQLVPSGDVYDFHVNLIRHGRAVCRARNPQCEVCILQEHCGYFQALPGCGPGLSSTATQAKISDAR